MFDSQTFLQWIDKKRRGTKLIVEKLSREEAFSGPLEEVVLNYQKKLSVQSLQYYVENIYRKDLVESADGKQKAIVCIPYDGNAEVLSILPSSYTEFQFFFASSLSSTEIVVSFNIDLDEKDAAAWKVAIGATIKNITSRIDWLNNAIKNYNENELPQQLLELIRKRREDLNRWQEFSDLLPFPLKKTSEALRKDLSFPMVRKEIPIEKSKKTPNPEYVIEYAEYLYILDIINATGVAIENSSKAIREMKEEDLRMFFLVQLNGHYNNSASAETFNKEGKTDIVVKKDGNNLFIAECKKWAGKEAFNQGIDNQLLNYISWRDTKTSYIIFNENKGFTDVITSARQAMESNAHFVKLEKELSTSCFLYKFRNKNDSLKEIYVCLHLFNLN